jgi:hypothetical protein
VHRAKIAQRAGATHITTAVPLIRANFDPDQVRVPVGNPDGGQWTDEGTGGTPASTNVEIGPEKPLQIAQGQTCQSFIAENCKASILRVFPGQFLDVPVDDVLDAAKSGDAAARSAKKLPLGSGYRK